MVRAIFFDFYSVWTPDVIQGLLDDSATLGNDTHKSLATLVEQYYRGEQSLSVLADTFRYKLSRPDIDENTLSLRESDISPTVINFMRNLHGHFIKLGILGNLGKMEIDLLNQFNEDQPLFEVILSPLSLGLDRPLLSKQVFVKALQEIGEPPSLSLVVSGHQDYLDFASKFGMQTIKFEGLPKLANELWKLLSKDIPSFVNPMQ